jgi:hypothetical protein
MNKIELEERRQFYKVLLSPTMSLDEKMDELGDLSREALAVLLEQFSTDEDYEICQAIKAVLEEKELGNIPD